MLSQLHILLTVLSSVALRTKIESAALYLKLTRVYEQDDKRFEGQLSFYCNWNIGRKNPKFAEKLTFVGEDRNNRSLETANSSH